MVRISEDKLYIPAKDGRILLLHRRAHGNKRAILISCGLKENSTFYERLAEDLADEQTTSYTLELRGHGSEGKWSLHDHRKDIAHILDLLHKKFKSVYVVASGCSAQVMLEREQDTKIHGMVLLDLEHAHCAVPLRVQTPTVALVKTHDLALLKKLFGPVRVHAGWKANPESVENRHLVLSAMKEILISEKPIRFALQK
jgi:hypothetical protein